MCVGLKLMHVWWLDFLNITLISLIKESVVFCLLAFFQVRMKTQHQVSKLYSISLLINEYFHKVAFLSSFLWSTCFLTEPHPRKYKCGLSAPCPPKHLAFRLVSGAANVIGPKICLEDKMWDSVLIISGSSSMCLSLLSPSFPPFFVLFCFHTVLFFSSVLS